MAPSITADVIVIGGGVAGLSTAMQLAGRGARVIVLERERIGNGSTGRAAGLLGQLRGNAEHTRMLIDGIEIVRQLEQQADVSIFVRTGSLRIAETPERASEIAALVEMGKSIGFDIDHLTIAEVAKVLPYMRTNDLIDACYCPTDGHIQPAELVSAYLKVGKQRGVEYRTNTPVSEILLDGVRVRGVKALGQEYHAPVVVNAGGPWSYLNAELVDAVLPTAAIGHYYLTTRPDPARPVDRLSPAIRDRHLRLYTRPESGGLIVGIYDPEPELHDMRRLPVDFDMSRMKAARDSLQVARLLEAATTRFPWIDERTPMSITTGIMTFTPDARPFCGKMPDIEGLYHCSGFSGHGIVQSPTIGLIMSQLILDSQSTYDCESIEADRYFEVPGYINRMEIEDKCVRMAGNYYGTIEPARSPAAPGKMKILVPTKRVPDTDQKIAATADGASVAIDHIPFVINPFDAIALEEAVRIGERLGDVEIVAVGIGGVEYEQQLRTALAMGATRAICVQCNATLDPWNVARLLKAVVAREQPDLVLMGKQAVDDDANQTGQFLAALLDWPQATFASRIEVMSAELRVDRETDFGIETLALPLPAVVTTDLRLNEPRYASMAGIMKARKKPLEIIDVDDLGVPLELKVEVVRYHSAETHRRGERLGSLDELAERLCESAGLGE